MQLENNLNERTLQEFEDNTIHDKLRVFERSKILKLWIRFYIEWFGIKNIDLENAHILFETGKKIPGLTMILVPRELTLSNFFSSLEKKNFIENRIENPDEEVVNTRRKRGTYLIYAKNQFTLLEELLVEIFNVYKTGMFLQYGHPLVGKYFIRNSHSRTTDRKGIYIESKTKDQKRVGIKISKKND